MRHAILLLAACGNDRGVGPSQVVAHVDKLYGYSREMILDGASVEAFLEEDAPAYFTVTMQTYQDGFAGSIFVREYRDGEWWSSSPSPGTAVFGEPRIDTGCDNCHRDNAEMPGMFTFHAAMDAVRNGKTAVIACDAEGTDPCARETYRAIVWR